MPLNAIMEDKVQCEGSAASTYVSMAQSAVGTVFRAAPSPLTVVGSPWSFSAAVKLTLRFSLLL